MIDPVFVSVRCSAGQSGRAAEISQAAPGLYVSLSAGGTASVSLSFSLSLPYEV